jgi:hypothetical protein
VQFLRRLFRRAPPVAPEPEPEPERPPFPDMQKVGQLPAHPERVESVPGTAMVVIAHESGVFVVDQDTCDFQYDEAYRSRPRPDPHDLEAVLRQATRVRVRAGGMARGQALNWPVLVDASDPDALAGLAPALAIQPPAAPLHCGCSGSPTLELFVGASPLLVLSLHHGVKVRCPRWSCDAWLQSPERLAGWLEERGVDGELLQLLYENALGLLVIPTGAPAVATTPVAQKVLLGELRQGRGDLQGAVAAWSDALALDPGCASAAELRSGMRERAGDLEGALVDLRRSRRAGRPTGSSSGGASSTASTAGTRRSGPSTRPSAAIPPTPTR